eukprot:12713354-Alexandrium_andersonii.AAC.1
MHVRTHTHTHTQTQQPACTRACRVGAEARAQAPRASRRRRAPAGSAAEQGMPSAPQLQRTRARACCARTSVQRAVRTCSPRTPAPTD